jgi:hypothetical protein
VQGEADCGVDNRASGRAIGVSPQKNRRGSADALLVRPPKEERDRRAAEKRAAMERDRVMSNGISGGPPGSGSEDAEGEDE